MFFLLQLYRTKKPNLLREALKIITMWDYENIKDSIQDTA